MPGRTYQAPDLVPEELPEKALMSGRGRGRGRGRGGVPINYPDGMMCKQPPHGSYPELAPPYGFQSSGMLPSPHAPTSAGKQLVSLWKQLHEHEDAVAFRLSSSLQAAG